MLDEAYVDFAAAEGFPSRLDWLDEYDNLAVLRTFSKLAGLAGLRLGYGAFPAWLRPTLWKIKQPYNVNVAASLAAVAALEEGDWLRATVGRLVAERERIARDLERLLARACDGTVKEVILATNFTNEGDATAHYLGEKLRARGLKVSRIARGLPVGGELEHTDIGTIGQALLERRPL